MLQSYRPTHEAGKFTIQLSRSIWGGGKGRDGRAEQQRQSGPASAYSFIPETLLLAE